MPGSAPVRECGCPVWARCVHFGSVLWLVDEDHPALEAVLFRSSRSHSGAEQRWLVGEAPRTMQCHCGNPEHIILADSASHFPSFARLPEAEAEFARRAEALRLGERDEMEEDR